jgi:hypothetical protein
VTDLHDGEASRQLAIQAIERQGLSWPAILDEDFPVLPENSPASLKYEPVTLE